MTSEVCGCLFGRRAEGRGGFRRASRVSGVLSPRGASCGAEKVFGTSRA